MMEKDEIETLYTSLLQRERYAFPRLGQPLKIPVEHGVYVIYQDENVLHVGRTIRGEQGLQQRLRNHLQGKSSFSRAYLAGNGNKLREKGYSYQLLEVPEPRKRALLESLAIGKLCPRHIGVGLSN